MKRGWATGISAVMQQEQYPMKRIFTAALCTQKQCSVSSPYSLTVCVHHPRKSLRYFFLILQLLYMDVSKVSEAGRGHLRRAAISVAVIDINTHQFPSSHDQEQHELWTLYKRSGFSCGWVGALSSSGTRRISSVTPLVAKTHL